MHHTVRKGETYLRRLEKKRGNMPPRDRKGETCPAELGRGKHAWGRLG